MLPDWYSIFDSIMFRIVGSGTNQLRMEVVKEVSFFRNLDCRVKCTELVNKGVFRSRFLLNIWESNRDYENFTKLFP